MTSLRVAIVGYGLSGRCFHAPLIATTEGLEVAVVVTSNAGRRTDAEREHPGVRVVDGVEEALAGRPDLVVVAVPNAGHVEIADAVIGAGVPLVVDKPLASTVGEAKGIVARARAASVPLTVFQNRRWDSDQLTLRRLLDEGALGEVARYESRFERWRPAAKAGAWRDELSSEEGGGVLLDLGSHLIDQAIDLFGPPTAVYAEVAARRGGPADDDAFVALHHHGGTISHLWCSAVAAVPAARLRVQGTAAGFVVADLDPQEAKLRSGEHPTGADFGMPTEPEYPRLVRGEESETITPEPGDWRRFYELLRDALTTGSPLPVEPEEALTTLRVLDAARRSAREGVVVAPDPQPRP
jgi:scyllo-inositol 2-dehydrogenase (NADP+)